MTNDTHCRLCGGSVQFLFSQNVLGKYDVSYHRCTVCHSLQTESPYWLEEAYLTHHLSCLDTGAAQRNLNNLVACYAISRLLKVTNVLDIGGGDGLLCRLLRDVGLNCYVKDKYAQPTYAQGFTDPNFDTPDLVIGFEVLEHYPEPMADLDQLFALKPRALLFSTALYTNQTQTWWYLSPQSGQHVFFYSQQAMSIIASQYHYDMVISGGYILFVKNSSWVTKMASTFLLKGKVRTLLKVIMAFLPVPGTWQDHAYLLAQSQQG